MAWICIFTVFRSSMSVPIMISLFNELQKGRSNWSVKVRIARKWKITVENTMKLPATIELILIDKEGARIQVTIPTSLICQFDDQLEEHSVYSLSNIFVVDNRSKFKITNHSYKLIFMAATEVISLGDKKFSKQHLFKLMPFPEIFSLDCTGNSFLIDVIGRVVGKGTLRYQHGSKFVEIELEDSSKNKLCCTLWEDYAKDMLTAIETSGDGPLVVLLQMFKPKSYQGKISLSNAFFGSKIYFESIIPEMDELKRFLSEDSSLSQMISDMSASYNIGSIDELENGNTEVKDVAGLKNCSQVSSDGKRKEDLSFCPEEIMGLVGRAAIFKVTVKQENLNGEDKHYSVGKVCHKPEIVEKHMQPNFIIKRHDILSALKEAGEEVIEISDSVSDNEDKSPNTAGIKRRAGITDDTATSNLIEDFGSATRNQIKNKAIKIEKV